MSAYEWNNKTQSSTGPPTGLHTSCCTLNSENPVCGGFDGAGSSEAVGW